MMSYNSSYHGLMTKEDFYFLVCTMEDYWLTGQYGQWVNWPQSVQCTLLFTRWHNIIYALVTLRAQHMTNCRSTSGSSVSGLVHPRTSWRTRNRSTWQSACFPTRRFRTLCPGARCFFGADNPRPRISACGGHGAYDREKNREHTT